jgi:hypothetical protein
MKTISTLVAMLCCAAPLGLSANAASDAPVVLVGGNDGASLPGLPGGRGGASGRVSAPTTDDLAALQTYCANLLDPTKDPRKSARSAFFTPDDCADYFSSLGAGLPLPPDPPFAMPGGKRDGADGPSIAGGVGGRGGRAGAGAGGGRGGAGGAGVAGGVGGRGGAGGATW